MNVKRVLSNNKNIYLFLLFSSLLWHTYLAYRRNLWYSDFYDRIGNRDSVASGFVVYIIINSLLVFVSFFMKYLQSEYVASGRYNLFDNLGKFMLCGSKDYAQRIAEDGTQQFDNFFTFCKDFTQGLLLILLNFCVLYGKVKIIHFIIPFLIYVVLIFFVNYKFVKKFLQKIVFNNQEAEGNLRKFLSSMFGIQCVFPIPIDEILAGRAISTMKSYFIIKGAIEFLKECFENIVIILPFIAFYQFYRHGVISFGEYMQIINACTMLNYGCLLFFNALKSLFEGEVNFRRIVFLGNKSSLHAENLTESLNINNVTIKYGKKLFVHDFNFCLKRGMKLNIFGDVATGKTSLFKEIRKTKILPLDILFIPESPIIPASIMVSNLCKTKPIFREKINELHKELDLGLNWEKTEHNPFGKMSGGEKWLFLFAYAECFDFVVWDDPEWGVNSDIVHQHIGQLETCLIFSRRIYDIDGFEKISILDLKNPALS